MMKIKKKVTKKRKVDSINKEDILKYVENQEVTPKRQEQLENRMCCAFVYAGIFFNIAANEIFRAWIQDLKPASGNSEESCQQLLRQLSSYKEGDPPFNNPFEPDCQMLQTCHLPRLANKLLTITSHLASCERVFSTLGWIYRKKRTRLSFEKLTLEDVLNVADGAEELDNGDTEEDDVMRIMRQNSNLLMRF
ncbi:15489_t:CDS:2 [Cetraspora pellucida]|uniref:15489_t:CDS:1 n=1 Tax=Cetraspora pellucida TaxID=1433469 RepID=A0ACA9L685_9GLOM|nr:15489_t:CDS:2 [Cetraspora pellucida]